MQILVLLSDNAAILPIHVRLLVLVNLLSKINGLVAHERFLVCAESLGSLVRVLVWRGPIEHLTEVVGLLLYRSVDQEARISTIKIGINLNLGTTLRQPR